MNLGHIVFAAAFTALAQAAPQSISRGSPDSPAPSVASATRAAGATPIQGIGVFDGLHGQPGIERIVADLVAHLQTDSRVSDIFKASDLEHLKIELSSQICFISGGPCLYDGKSMKAAHKDLGLQDADLNALVEDLQNAMDREGVPFRVQNQLLAKLAPMRKDVVVR